MHQIGAGTLGPVYRTYEPARDRLVAVKVFRLDLTPEQVETFARHLARLVERGLNHRAIVPLLAAGTEGAVPYLALEYVAAESLETALRHYAPATPEFVAASVRALGGAIDHAAAREAPHGALHPRDIFVAPDEVRATGFGVVPLLEGLGIAAPVRRPYTAPERVEGRTWGLAADVFSLAALAVELLTARRITGPGVAPDLSGARPEVAANEALQQVLAAALAEAPEARYPTGEAFGAAFETALTSGRFQAPRPSGVVVAMRSERTRARSDSARAEMPRRPRAVREDAPSTSRDRSARAAPSRDLFDESPADPAAFELPPRELNVELDEDALRLTPEEVNTPTPEEAAGEAVWAQAPLEKPEPLEFSSMSSERLEAEESTARSRGLDLDEKSVGGAVSSVPAATPAAAAAESAASPSSSLAPRLLPYAFVLMLGLLAGFVVGYGMGSRERPDVAPSAPAVATKAPLPSGSGVEALEGSGLRAGPPPEALPPPREAPEPSTSSAAPDRPGEMPPSRSAPAARAERSAPVPRAGAPDTAARPAVPLVGRVAIRSTPEKAGVVVDGTWRGRTPLSVEALPFGSHTVRVVLPGYRPVTRRVVLTETAPAATLNVELTAEAAPQAAASAASRAAGASSAAAQTPWGSLLVDSDPRGARVFLDDRLVGDTPLLLPEVAPGTHRLRVERNGFRPWTSSVSVAAGARGRVTASLVRRR